MDPLTLEGESRANERRKMIKEALEEKSPQLYRQLQKKGTLDAFVNDRERELMSAYTGGYSEVVLDQASEKKAKPNPIEQAKEIEARLRNLWEETLATYLEF